VGKNNGRVTGFEPAAGLGLVSVSMTRLMSELVAVKASAAAAQDAAGALECLDIKIIPQKLNERNRCRLLGQFTS
jgi:hypothetical protein